MSETLRTFVSGMRTEDRSNDTHREYKIHNKTNLDGHILVTQSLNQDATEFVQPEISTWDHGNKFTRAEALLFQEMMEEACRVAELCIENLQAERIRVT